MEGLIEPADLDPCGRRFQAEIGAEQVLVALAPTRWCHPATSMIASAPSAAMKLSD